MTACALPHAPRPCGKCPWRLDAKVGKFPPDRYEQLQNTSGRPGEEAPLDAPIFACHLSAESRDWACAGWLAVVGQDHLGVRLAVAMSRLPASVLTPAPGWPELYPSYDAMAIANGYDREARADAQGIMAILLASPRRDDPGMLLLAAEAYAALRSSTGREASRKP